jgi:hypothetical protein
METQPHDLVTVHMKLSEAGRMSTAQIWDHCRQQGLDPRGMWPTVDEGEDEIVYEGKPLTEESPR